MMRSSVYHVLDKLNELELKKDKMSDKSYDLYTAGNVKKSELYDRKVEALEIEVKGFTECLKMLGLGAWRDNTGRWHIPLDDIERVC